MGLQNLHQSLLNLLTRAADDELSGTGGAAAAKAMRDQHAELLKQERILAEKRADPRRWRPNSRILCSYRALKKTDATPAPAAAPAGGNAVGESPGGWPRPSRSRDRSCGNRSERQLQLRVQRQQLRAEFAWMRFNASSLSASKRITSTGVVLDARQAPAVGEIHAGRRWSRRAFSNRDAAARKRSTKACGSPFGASTLISGVTRRWAAASTVLRRFRARRQDLHQSRRRVDAVVEAEPAFAEEEMPLISPAPVRRRSRASGLDQRMPVFHQRAAAVAQDAPGRRPALHVVQGSSRPGCAQHVGGEQHQQAVGIDVLAARA